VEPVHTRWGTRLRMHARTRMCVRERVGGCVGGCACVCFCELRAGFCGHLGDVVFK
jgi:hypothetical protein